MPLVFIGVDPGLGGAIARIYPGGPAQVWDIESSQRSPKKRQVDPYRFRELIAEAVSAHDRNDVMILVEDVHAMPAQGVSSTFGLGLTCGIIEGVIASMRLPMELVRPNDWKKGVGLPKATDKKAGKEIARTFAIRWYPDLADQMGRVKDHNRAEALLIARYCQQAYA